MKTATTNELLGKLLIYAESKMLISFHGTLKSLAYSNADLSELNTSVKLCLSFLNQYDKKLYGSALFHLENGTFKKSFTQHGITGVNNKEINPSRINRGANRKKENKHQKKIGKGTKRDKDNIKVIVDTVNAVNPKNSKKFMFNRFILTYVKNAKENFTEGKYFESFQDVKQAIRLNGGTLQDKKTNEVLTKHLIIIAEKIEEQKSINGSLFELAHKAIMLAAKKSQKDDLKTKERLAILSCDMAFNASAHHRHPLAANFYENAILLTADFAEKTDVHRDAIEGWEEEIRDLFSSNKQLGLIRTKTAWDRHRNENSTFFIKISELSQEFEKEVHKVNCAQIQSITPSEFEKAFVKRILKAA